jgi:N-acyl-D-aspartate/D-glutamate deacylase
MGDEAWERAATGPEREAVAELLSDALGAGAFGLSTSLGFDTDPDGRPAPSQLADDDELGRLADELAASQRFLQFIPTPGRRRLMRDVQRVADITGPRDVTSTWINLFDDPDVPGLAAELLEFAAGLQAEGVPTYPQVSPRTLDIQANWDGGMSFSALVEGWHRVVQADRAGKRRLLEDPAWRATARAEWDRVPRAVIPHKAIDRIRLMSASRPEDQRWIAATLADLVAERGGHPSDVLADWVLANDLAPAIISVGVANSDPAGVAATLRHPAAVIANSDAGAHVQMMCAAGDTTLLLTRHVRDRADLGVEQAVHELTGRQAELFGFAGRGVLAPGAVGDLVVFALDELSWEPDVPVRDLPAGGSRLRRPPGGYRTTVVGGVVTQQDGRPSDALPGTVLRRGVTE